VYDALIADPEITHASFLWYEREEAVGRLFETKSSSELPADLGGLADLILAPVEENA
jgi:hypothetical protein